MPSPMCRLCGEHNSVESHGLCFSCNMPEQDLANAWRLIWEGRFLTGFGWMEHALTCRAVRDADIRKRALAVDAAA